jgi:hypothetical protein
MFYEHRIGPKFYLSIEVTPFFERTSSVYVGSIPQTMTHAGDLWLDRDSAQEQRTFREGFSAGSRI